MKTIAKHRENGKKNNIIINAEGLKYMYEILEDLSV